MRLFDKKIILSIVASLLLTLSPMTVFAEGKSYRVVLSSQPGGYTDQVCRAFWTRYDKLYNTRTVFSLKPNQANGVMAARAIAGGEADAWCMVSGDIAFAATNPNRENPVDSINPIGMLFYNTVVFVSGKHQPFNSVDEFKQFTLQSPTPIKIAAPAPPWRVFVEFMRDQLGFNVTPVVYRTAAEALPELISGAIDFGLGGNIEHTKTMNPDGRLVITSYSIHDELDRFKHMNIGPNLAVRYPKALTIASWIGISTSKQLSDRDHQHLSAAFDIISKDKDFINEVLSRHPFNVVGAHRVTADDLNKIRQQVVESVGMQKP
jgi:tripartite-type tricarboxylate transporter receptor subunit TctC